MKRFIFSVFFAAMAFVALPAQAQIAAGCPYQPGAPFSAEIRIAVSDRDVRADSAVVRVNGQIPGGGRVAGPRYVAALQPMPVQLQNDSIKHFSIAPSIVVENANTPQCVLRMEAGVTGRNWALDTNTNFVLDATVTVNGRVETSQSRIFTSCFDQDTQVRLASGEAVAVKMLVPGDLIWNPLLKREIAVRRVIQGTQADETLYRIGYAGGAVLFTGQHPVLTRGGLRVARAVTPDNEILGEDGAFHKVTVLQTHAGDATRLVYNLELEAPDGQWEAHVIAVEGIVAGDFYLQEAASD
jgi:hypothetical protein